MRPIPRFVSNVSCWYREDFGTEYWHGWDTRRLMIMAECVHYR